MVAERAEVLVVVVARFARRDLAMFVIMASMCQENVSDFKG